MRKERKLDPTTGRGLYGAELRRVRTEAGLSLAQLADALRYSKTHLGNIETADRVPPPRFSEMIDRHFGTGGHFARLWPLARREAHPNKYRRVMECDASAEKIEDYAGMTVPGLLQTEDYARGLIRACKPTADGDVIEDLVAARLSRQERLSSDRPPRLWAILDEAVIRRPIGGVGVMCAQLRALIPLVDTGTITIQVMPFSAGGHPVLGGSVTLMTMSDHTKVAYVEGTDYGQLIEDPEDVELRQQAYDLVRAYALNPRDSAQLLTQAIKEFQACLPST